MLKQKWAPRQPESTNWNDSSSLLLVQIAMCKIVATGDLNIFRLPC